MACNSKTDYKRRLRESPPEIFHTQHLQKTPQAATQALGAQINTGSLSPVLLGFLNSFPWISLPSATIVFSLWERASQQLRGASRSVVDRSVNHGDLGLPEATNSPFQKVYSKLKTVKSYQFVTPSIGLKKISKKHTVTHLIV